MSRQGPCGIIETMDIWYIGSYGYMVYWKLWIYGILEAMDIWYIGSYGYMVYWKLWIYGILEAMVWSEVLQDDNKLQTSMIVIV